jgi:hypothetical protein
MGLLTTALAFGAGYTLGRPGGRAQVQKYLRQVRELASRPEARHLRERGWDVAGGQVAAVRRRLDARNRAAAGRAPEGPPAAVTDVALSSFGSVIPGPDPASSGFGGTSIEEDSRAALGFPTPAPSERPGTPGPTPPGP